VGGGVWRRRRGGVVAAGGPGCAGGGAGFSAPPTPSGSPVVVDGFLGPAKGARSPEGEAAATLVARTEGVFLDPVFGAKAMAGLVDAAGQGTVRGPVVFLVSGGAPTLFAD